MTEIIGVKFRSEGRIYSFNPGKNKYKIGDYVIVNTARGLECGLVAAQNHKVEEAQIVKPLKEVVRPATEADIKKMNDNKKREESAFKICEKQIEKHKLDMKLVDVEITFDSSKMIFYFTADNRVDFRELVKDLASYFHTRIELRQIGVRDEAKKLGGLGICGQQFCCSRFLNDFQPVSIKMAKEQNLSLNPTKISGCCGRLMCCLKYEQDVYEELNRLTPHVGSLVDTPEGAATVVDSNLLSGNLRVKVGEEGIPFNIHRDRVRIIKKVKPKKNTEEEKLAKQLED